MINTKLCTHCKLNKPIESFNFKSKLKNARHSTCQGCSRLSIREHYHKNRAYYLAKAKAFRDNQKRIIRSCIREYLQRHPCIDCGENDPLMLEFDHTQEKSFNISSAVKQLYSLSKLQSEISKCVVRCANCHRKKTAIQFGWNK